METDLEVLREELAWFVCFFFNQTTVTSQWCHVAVPSKGGNKLHTPLKNCR